MGRTHIIQEKDRKFLEDKFAKELTGDVNLLFFTQRESQLKVPGLECHTCQDTRQLLDELVSLSPKLHFQTYDFVADEAQRQAYGVAEIPAIVLDGVTGGRLRFYGLPSGYEFATLIDVLVATSQGSPGLSKETMDTLAKINQDVHLQVFVTPT